MDNKKKCPVIKKASETSDKRRKLKAIKQKYTAIQPYWGIEEYPTNAQTVHLVVGSQSFCVTPIHCDNMKEAKWMQDRLAEAINNILIKEGGRNKNTM